MKNYTVVKWEKLLLWLIPPILRKKTHYDWLNTLLSPIHTIYEETLYKMQHTGQVIYLDKILNEAFNPGRTYNPNYSIAEKRSEKLIYIEESVKPVLYFLYLHNEYLGLSLEETFVFSHGEITDSEQKPLYLANKLDYTKMAYANFRVFIPEDLNFRPQVQFYSELARMGNNGGVVHRELTLKELSDKLVFNFDSDGIRGMGNIIEVHTAKYHDLLNFYKLAGKTYESCIYLTSSNISKQKIRHTEL